MTQPSVAAPPALTQTIDVETPELVVLTYTIAGVGSRAYAALIDYLICFICLFAIDLGLAVVVAAINSSGRDTSAAWVIAAFVFLNFVGFWGYHVLFEALADGQTPGKRSQHLRVVRDGGYSVTFGASAIRNLVRIVDMQPFLMFAVGLTSVIFSKTGKRLGDMAAGTIVVKEAMMRKPVAIETPPPVPRADEAAPLHTALTDAEFQLLERFVQRKNDLAPARRAAMGAQLAQRFAGALADFPGTTDVAQLVALHSAERAARNRGLAARHDTGAARERHAIVAAGSPRWARFAKRLAVAQQGGLRVLGEAGVREFVAEYRELTSDLARLRTAARDGEADELFYLNRLLSGAHNLLYRRRSLPFRDIVNFLFVDVPREIRASAAPILLAGVLLFAPAAIAYVAVVRDPVAATMLMPPSMLDRADNGVKNAQNGDGYIRDPDVFRPVMASSIITNNVQVAIAAFAFGISAGVLTTWVLLSNGVSLGAVFGLYSSKGIGSLLLAFVAPHGVLELTAICVSGGAGFLLAAALLIPGQRTRRTALIENGKRAIRLVAGAGMMLVVAGTIEGFVSPIEYWPLDWKLSVSALTAVLLYIYVRLGAPRAIALPEP
jgi:uncharacterized membrane protein SpoIIM required for sporulation/uncharacterized RDD family membrane protein YckC